GQHLINLLLLIGVVALAVVALSDISNADFISALDVIALVLGKFVVIPIGGADMPVLISMPNLYSGMAACATGFVLNNNVLIVAGALVGASGIILTQIMCKAMNRSLINVLLGGFGQTTASIDAQDGPQISVKEVGLEEAAQIFDSVS